MPEPKLPPPLEMKPNPTEGQGSYLLTTNRKALTLNLDPRVYGTFAEIGAGQEVARCFFQAGGAAGTIAKSISAYDMSFSDAIYGRAERYVSRSRLSTMLDHEYELLMERLTSSRGRESCFFVFADTVAAKSFRHSQDGHGWMGVRFQSHPGNAPSDIVIHVRMWDRENVLQQQALGIIGVNLLYGAFHYHEEPERLIDSLLDNLGSERIEVDMVHFSGPDFSKVDNRLLSLRLVEKGLTNAVLFSPGGEVLQPSEVFYKRAILVERGTFRPVTKVNQDMITCALAQFVQEPLVNDRQVLALMEITVNSLQTEGVVDPHDFLARVDTLGALGHHVLISNYFEFYRLTSYFRRYTSEMIGVTMGVGNLLEIFNEKYYENLAGGILENFGRLFRNAVKLYIYPMIQGVLGRAGPASSTPPIEEHSPGGVPILITARNVQMPLNLRNLYAHLLENHYVESIVGFDERLLGIQSSRIREQIRLGEQTWCDSVPAAAVDLIRSRRFFGWEPSPPKMKA